MPSIFSQAKTLGKPFLISILVFFVALIWIVTSDDVAIENQGYKETTQLVSSFKRNANTKPFAITTTGLTSARWATDLVTVVEGRIISLPDTLEPGTLVDNQQLLVGIEAHRYQAEVDNASSQLSHAQLELDRAKHEQTVGTSNLTRRKTAYARFEPQVEAAKQALIAAASNLKSSQRQVQNTEIRAPFPAIILQKYVTPGQWLNSGSVVFKIAASDSIDIKVQLSNTQWKRLAPLALGQVAEVIDQNGQTWQAKIRFIYPERDPVTRQRSIMLSVLQPYTRQPSLLPNQVVSVSLQGRAQDDVYEIMASALTEDGQVWTVDSCILSSHKVEVLHQNEINAWIKFIPDNSTLLAKTTAITQQLPTQRSFMQFVAYPLGNMMAGQRVDVIELTSNAAANQPTQSQTVHCGITQTVGGAK